MFNSHFSNVWYLICVAWSKNEYLLASLDGSTEHSRHGNEPLLRGGFVRVSRRHVVQTSWERLHFGHEDHERLSAAAF